MVTPRTGRRRGRPAWDWRTYPDRYAIALADALAAFGMSEREAIDAAVIQFDTRKRPAQVAGAATFELRPEPGMAATIKGRASTLRQKSKLNPAGFAAWRAKMALAIMIAMGSKEKAAAACAGRVMELA